MKSNEKKRKPGMHKSYSDVFGMEGSFRQLAFDWQLMFKFSKVLFFSFFFFSHNLLASSYIIKVDPAKFHQNNLKPIESLGHNLYVINESELSTFKNLKDSQLREGSILSR